MAAKKNITIAQMETICGLIAAWEAGLTWDRLTEKIATEMDLEVTRQTLNKYSFVKESFQHRKDELRGLRPTNFQKRPSVKLADALKTIERQKREIALLKRQRDAQLEKLRNALYNAKNHNPPIYPEELLKSPPETIKE